MLLSCQAWVNPAKLITVMKNCTITITEAYDAIKHGIEDQNTAFYTE